MARTNLIDHGPENPTKVKATYFIVKSVHRETDAAAERHHPDP
jgi:hypothetical protein